MKICNASGPAALFIIYLTLMCSCQTTTEKIAGPSVAEAPAIKVAHLGEGAATGLSELRNAFASRNPGYDLQYFAAINKLPSSGQQRIAFVQTGGGTATLSSGEASKFSVGDIIVLRAGDGLIADSLLSLVVFTVPQELPGGIPAFIRPDWDPNITDTPGGCATETNAYRRILLTWLDKVGPYRFHALNAHRVRITDSFTHYHPEEGGFDEFYLVQMSNAQSKLLTSTRVDLIEKPEEVSSEQAANLLQSMDLAVGDLVYLPRGTVHRGLGGVLAQVITVPGFVPGSEIGVDHHLRKINEHLKLEGNARIPFNESASLNAIVK